MEHKLRDRTGRASSLADEYDPAAAAGPDLADSGRQQSGGSFIRTPSVSLESVSPRCRFSVIA